MSKIVQINNIINKYVKCRIELCFYVDGIKITSMDKNFINRMKSFFTPYFSFSYSSKLSTDVEFEVIILDELQIIEMVDLMVHTQSSYQYVGGNKKYIEWKTIYEGDYIISYNKDNLSIVIQCISKKELTIIGVNTSVDRVITKIITDEVIYPKYINNGSIILSSIAISKNKTALVIDNTNISDTLLLKFIKDDNDMTLISPSLNIVLKRGESFIVNGTTELLKTNMRTLKKLDLDKVFFSKRQLINYRRQDSESIQYQVIGLESKYISRKTNCNLESIKNIDMIIVINDDINNNKQSDNKLDLRHVIENKAIKLNKDEVKRPWYLNEDSYKFNHELIKTNYVEELCNCVDCYNIINIGDLSNVCDEILKYIS